jgi:hypothetical protein
MVTNNGQPVRESNVLIGARDLIVGSETRELDYEKFMKRLRADPGSEHMHIAFETFVDALHLLIATANENRTEPYG